MSYFHVSEGLRLISELNMFEHFSFSLGNCIPLQGLLLTIISVWSAQASHVINGIKSLKLLNCSTEEQTLNYFYFLGTSTFLFLLKCGSGKCGELQRCVSSWWVGWASLSSPKERKMQERNERGNCRQ